MEVKYLLMLRLWMIMDNCYRRDHNCVQNKEMDTLNIKSHYHPCKQLRKLKKKKTNKQTNKHLTVLIYGEKKTSRYKVVYMETCVT